MLVTALLDVHKSIESERNAICHGFFGVNETFPDILLWITTDTYIDFKSRFSIANMVFTDNHKDELLFQDIFLSKSRS
jgi:hypothetical protein